MGELVEDLSCPVQSSGSRLTLKGQQRVGVLRVQWCISEDPAPPLHHKDIRPSRWTDGSARGQELHRHCQQPREACLGTSAADVQDCVVDHVSPSAHWAGFWAESPYTSEGTGRFLLRDRSHSEKKVARRPQGQLHARTPLAGPDSPVVPTAGSGRTSSQLTEGSEVAPLPPQGVPELFGLPRTTTASIFLLGSHVLLVICHPLSWAETKTHCPSATISLAPNTERQEAPTACSS